MKKKFTTDCQVSALYTFTLGGYPQKVSMEGKRKDLPVVITLHGGPGTPIPFCTGARGLFPQFTDHAIMVYWDQLGCGINNQPLDDTLRICDFVDMTADLIREVKALFPENRLYLLATSWGSVLSAQVLEKASHVDGVLVSGQITHRLFFNSHVMDALEASRIPEGKLEAIRQMEPQMICNEDMKLISSCVRKYTDGYQNRQGKNLSFRDMMNMMGGLFKSPDYRMKDVKALVLNAYTGRLGLWPELLRLDLRQSLKNVTVPYHMLQGDTDIVATTAYVQELVSTAGNPNLRCTVLPHTGHLPGPEAMDALLTALLEMIAQ